jgi:DNA-binding beta-propeller fold protein YncE
MTLSLNCKEAGDPVCTHTMYGNVNEVTNDIEVGIDPVDLEFNPSNNYVYVANEGSNTCLSY